MLLFLLFFLSGAASLVYEVTWTRSLGLGSQGVPFLDGDNVVALAMARESLLPYLVPDMPRGEHEWNRTNHGRTTRSAARR